jgi:hypothetical protein
MNTRIKLVLNWKGGQRTDGLIRFWETIDLFYLGG